MMLRQQIFKFSCRAAALLLTLLFSSATLRADYSLPPGEGAEVLTTSPADSVVIQMVLHFSSGNGDWIEKSEYPVVGRFLRWALRDSVSLIYLTGWTDTTGTAAFNQRLSEKRAAAVKHYLVRKGIDPGRIYATGCGEDASVEPGQARRVEMRGVIPDRKTAQTGQATPTMQAGQNVADTQARQEQAMEAAQEEGDTTAVNATAGQAVTAAQVGEQQPGQPSFTASSAIAEPIRLPNRYVALKTNLAAWAGTILNIAADVQVAGHISVELPVLWCPWYVSNRHAVKTFTIQPEVRYWLAKPGEGHFFGVHAHAGWFNVKWDKDRYQDTDRPLLGAGISYGYLLPFNEHWAGEFTLGAGYANMRYDTYYNIDNGARIDTRTKNYWGITRVGISVVYRFNIKK